MSVAYYSETPNVTPDLAQHISDDINERLSPSIPEGGLFHAEGPTDEGSWWAFSLWESDADFTRFSDTILVAAMNQAGLILPTYIKRDVKWDTSQMRNSPT
jgi:hypothetical protein